MPEIVIQFLEEDATSGIARGINFKACWMVWFPHSEDGFLGEFVFEDLEGKSLGDFPCPRNILFNEIVERLS